MVTQLYKSWLNSWNTSDICQQAHSDWKHRKAQSDNLACDIILQDGWPKISIPPLVKPYSWESQGNLTVGDGLLLYDSHIVISTALQGETLKKLHEGYQSIVRCGLRANTCICVWWARPVQAYQWLSANVQIAFVRPLHPRNRWFLHLCLNIPGRKLAHSYKGVNYLVIINYFSCYPDIVLLKTTTSDTIIATMKSIFARYGIPDTVVSNNGPQFSSQDFTAFANSYNYAHIKSSPHYRKSNGHAEHTVKTIKRLLKNSNDLSYRATPPLWCGISPAELLMDFRFQKTS